MRRIVGLTTLALIAGIAFASVGGWFASAREVAREICTVG